MNLNTLIKYVSGFKSNPKKTEF
jgi:hypothetical protein